MAGWLASSGACISLVARNKSALEAVADPIDARGGSAFPIQADMSSFPSCRGAVRSGLEKFGRLDAVINNAATVEPLMPIRNTDPEAWEKAIATNLLGPMVLIQESLPELERSGGRIINITSGAAQIPLAAAGAYCSSKSALNHLTRVLGEEFSTITSIAIRPGLVDTPMQAHLRIRAPKTMPSEQAAYYHHIKSEGLLEPPHVPARAIAWAALHAPAQWSGKIMDYDDPLLANPARKYFGDNPK